MKKLVLFSFFFLSVGFYLRAQSVPSNQNNTNSVPAPALFSKSDTSKNNNTAKPQLSTMTADPQNKKTPSNTESQSGKSSTVSPKPAVFSDDKKNPKDQPK